MYFTALRTAIQNWYRLLKIAYAASKYLSLEHLAEGSNQTFREERSVGSNLLFSLLPLPVFPYPMPRSSLSSSLSPTAAFGRVKYLHVNSPWGCVFLPSCMCLCLGFDHVDMNLGCWTQRQNHPPLSHCLPVAAPHSSCVQTASLRVHVFSIRGENQMWAEKGYRVDFKLFFIGVDSGEQ